MRLLSLLLLGIAGSASAIEVSVDGEGYLRLLQDGRAVFSKKVSLSVAGGRLAGNGLPFLPALPLSSLEKVNVGLDGTVNVGSIPVGRFVLAFFDTPCPAEGVFSMATRCRLGNPGEGTCGVIRTESNLTAAPINLNPNAKRQTPNASESGCEILLKRSAEVSAEVITLGEIATLTGSAKDTIGQIPLGKSPALSRNSSITRAEILSKIREAGHKPENLIIKGAGPIAITRKSQTIPHADFIQAAREAIQLTDGLTLGLPSSDPEFLAPSGTITLTAGPTSITSREASVIVSVMVDNKPANSRKVSFALIQPPIAIRANQEVTVLFRKNDLVVEAKGKTKKDAYLGGRITVIVSLEKNQPTEHTGIVTKPGVVEVTL